MKINIKYQEVKERAFEVELPHYRAHIMSNGNEFALYKVTGTEKNPIVNSIYTCSDVYSFRDDCVQNAFSDETIEVDEQRWAEALVKLSAQAQELLKEYSI